MSIFNDESLHTNSHPNLQMSIICHSGLKALIGGEINRTGFGKCHSAFWTFLDVFVSRILQICAVFGLVSDHQIFGRGHQILWTRNWSAKGPIISKPPV